MSTAQAVRLAVESPPPDTAAAEEIQYGPIYSAYPRMWIGFVLVGFCWFMQLAALGSSGSDKEMYQGVAYLAGFTGYAYWMFSVYRIHKILAEYTQGKYRIAPWKSVTFQFIPLYSLYWLFKWPATLADFVNGRASAEGTAKRLRRGLPAILLLAASMFGFEAGLGFQLVLSFAIGVYLTSRLKHVLPRPEPVSFRRLEQLRVAASAGIGSAFSLLLFEAFHEFFSKMTSPAERIHHLLAIALVSIGVLIFLEPLFERLRLSLGLSHEHPALELGHSIRLRVIVFSILVITSLLHGIAHTALDGWIDNPAQRLQKMMALAAALLISGGITYFWIGAAHTRRRHATRSGAFAGMMLAAVVVVTLSSIASNQPAPAVPALPTAGGATIAQAAFPGVPAITIISEQVARGDFPTRVLLAFALTWLLMGAIGGAVIDHRLARCSALNLGFSIVGAAIAAGLLLRIVGHHTWTQAFWHLPAVAGWVLALIVCCSPRTLGLNDEPPHTGHYPIIMKEALGRACGD